MDEWIVERDMLNFKLQVRPAPSRLWTFASPLLALVLTVLIGIVVPTLGQRPGARFADVFLGAN